jgi:hypothetical protein
VDRVIVKSGSDVGDLCVEMVACKLEVLDVQ